jgi:hypothetical protein
VAAPLTIPCASPSRARAAKEPGQGVGKREAAETPHRGSEAQGDYEAATKAVRNLAEEQQGGDQDHGVGGEDQSQDRAGKTEPFAVTRVQRRRQVGAEEHREEGKGDDRHGGAVTAADILGRGDPKALEGGQRIHTAPLPVVAKAKGGVV